MDGVHSIVIAYGVRMTKVTIAFTRPSMHATQQSVLEESTGTEGLAENQVWLISFILACVWLIGLAVFLRLFFLEHRVGCSQPTRGTKRKKYKTCDIVCLI